MYIYDSIYFNSKKKFGKILLSPEELNIILTLFNSYSLSYHHTFISVCGNSIIFTFISMIYYFLAKKYVSKKFEVNCLNTALFFSERTPIHPPGQYAVHITGMSQKRM